MQADFYNAFQRHWKDAEYLYADSRWLNADQLYALSAECGLKCLMLQFRMPVDSSGSPIQDKFHINKIWNRYEAYRAGIGATGYELPQINPFHNWDINQRYANDSNFNQARVDVHKQGTEFVRKLIYKALLEGRLSA